MLAWSKIMRKDEHKKQHNFVLKAKIKMVYLILYDVEDLLFFFLI